MTLTPCKHWGARTIHDEHRGAGALSWSTRAGAFITRATAPTLMVSRKLATAARLEIALLPIGAYYPDSFRHVHMGPDEAMHVFRDIKAKWFVPMHYGAFKLSFEEMDAPPKWLREIAERDDMTHHLVMLDEGVPHIFPRVVTRLNRAQSGSFWSGQQTANHFAMHIGEASLDAVVVKGEPFVIQAEQVQNGGVEIVNAHWLVRREIADFVGSAVAETRLQSRSSHPNGEDVLMMITALAVDALSDGRAAKFSRPEHECIFEEAAGFQILKRPATGLSMVDGLGGMIIHDIFVAIPIDARLAERAAIEQLHEAHAALNQSASQQDNCGRSQRSFRIQSVKLFCRFAFLLQAHHIGNTHLHARGQFVGTNACREAGVARIGVRETPDSSCRASPFLALRRWGAMSARALQDRQWDRLRCERLRPGARPARTLRSS